MSEITGSPVIRCARPVTPGEVPARLAALTAHGRHRFWPDALPYDEVRWHGVIGYRQVTDAYLAALARSNRGKLATSGKGLVALRPSVGVALEG